VNERPETEQRIIDLSVEVPGTPEQAWQAIATGPGITAWFVPHQVQERQGGTVRMDFGPGFGEALARVTAWEPPHRVVFSSEGDRALAYEWLVEARDGGTCLVRLVNSGFGPGADWDADYDGLSSGWRIFLQNLRLHLTHFPGQPARAMIPTRIVAGPHHARVCQALRGTRCFRRPAGRTTLRDLRPGRPRGDRHRARRPGLRGDKDILRAARAARAGYRAPHRGGCR
jgi:uncharacterized protein YndB with AHSA1/START domain